MESDSSSIHELLEMFKYFKTNNNDLKTKDISTLSFSSRNYQSVNRNPLDSICMQNMSNLNTTGKSKAFSKNNENVFDKLYQQKKEIQIRRCRLEYQTRKSKQEKQRSQCTFSPNIHSRHRIRTDYDSIQNTNQSFYIKNMEWLQRKDKSIKKLQCQKNEQNVNVYTFTPRINKPKSKNYSKIEENRKVTNNKGVSDYLQRQEKAKKNQQYIKNRQKNPYSHVWTVKRGHFSDPLYLM